MVLKVRCALMMVLVTWSAHAVNLSGYYKHIANYYPYAVGVSAVDSAAAGTQVYEPVYAPTSERLNALKPQVTSSGISQYQQIPNAAQSTAYSHYLSPPYSIPHPSYAAQRYNPPVKHYQSPSETIITPVQHSTVIHHTPYLASVTSPNPYVHINSKPSVQVHHPLQKPLHYSQPPQHPQYAQHGQNAPQLVPHPQRVQTSPQVYPHLHYQEPQVPIRNPAPVRQSPAAPEPAKSHSNSGAAEDVDDKESEDVEEDNEDVEDKGDLNEESEDDEDANEEVGRYHDEEEAEEEEEERPKYASYSFRFNSPQSGRKHKGREREDDREPERENEREREGDDDDDNDDDHRGGYRTHEDVDEDNGEDADEGSSRVKYSKKTPKDYSKFEKFDKRPPINKYATNANQKKFHYEQFDVPKTTTPKLPSKQSNSKSKDKSHNYQKDAQGKPSHTAPVTTFVREKWFIMKKNA